MNDEPDKHEAIENTIRCSSGFDYAQVDGETPINEQTPEPADLARAAIAFRDILDWITGQGRSREAVISARLHAFLWVMLPSSLPQRSQREIADKLGLSKTQFGFYVSDFRDEFNVTASHLRSNQNRANSRRGQQTKRP